MNYERHYWLLMRKAEREHLARSKNRKAGQYYERHHVFQRAIYGHDKKVNNFTVLLTYREHVVAHWLWYRHWLKEKGTLNSRTVQKAAKAFQSVALMLDAHGHRIRNRRPTRVLKAARELAANISKIQQKSKVASGTHHLLGGEIARKMVSEGTHNFLGGNIQSKAQKRLVDAGGHQFQNSNFQRKRAKKRVEEGTHHFLGLKPWQHPRATNATLGLWSLADRIFEQWQLFDYGPKRLKHSLGFNANYSLKPLQNMCRYFKDGWKPRDDPDWIFFVDDYSTSNELPEIETIRIPISRPWNHQRSTEASKAVWRKAQEAYQHWSVTGCGEERLAKYIQLPQGKVSCRNMIKMFKKNWKPKEDPEWRSFIEQTSG
jgi:hypothetical protein